MKERKSQFTLYIRRKFSNIHKYTIGDIYVNEKEICNSLEDPVRMFVTEDYCPYTSKGKPCKCGQKVYGDTAIPAGEYWGRVSWSPKFSPKSQKCYIEIMDVPHFLGIRVHAGTDKTHTEGCPLTGDYKESQNGRLINSFARLADLEAEVKKHLIGNNFNETGGFFRVIITNEFKK